MSNNRVRRKIIKVKSVSTKLKLLFTTCTLFEIRNVLPKYHSWRLLYLNKIYNIIFKGSFLRISFGGLVFISLFSISKIFCLFFLKKKTSFRYFSVETISGLFFFIKRSFFCPFLSWPKLFSMNNIFSRSLSLGTHWSFLIILFISFGLFSFSCKIFYFKDFLVWREFHFTLSLSYYIVLFFFSWGCHFQKSFLFLTAHVYEYFYLTKSKLS